MCSSRISVEGVTIQRIVELEELANALFPEVPRTSNDWRRVLAEPGVSAHLAYVAGSPRGYLQSTFDETNRLAYFEIALIENESSELVAAALHEVGLSAVAGLDLSDIRATVLGDDTFMSTYWPRAGFVELDRYHRLALDLPLQIAPLPAVVTIEELDESSASLRDAHAMYAAGTTDQPGGGTPLPFDEWRVRLLDDGERCVIGRDQKSIIGFASLRISEARPTTAFSTLTAIEPRRRGEGLGLQFKAALAMWACAEGITRLETASAASNAPMRSINAKLGFQPMPDVVVYCCEM